MSLINREKLIAEYDRVHVGEPGRARKLMVDATEVKPDRMKLVQQAVNTIMSTCRSYSIRDRAFRNAARLVQCAIDGEAHDFEQIPEGDEMPSEPRWIPVSERLPEIGEHHVSEPCIVYCSNGAYGFAGLEENIFGQVGWNCERDDEYHEPLGDVLAWMPLPEPYREDGEADD